jgi:membrane protein DedA with SNARE-associated domain
MLQGRLAHCRAGLRVVMFDWISHFLDGIVTVVTGFALANQHWAPFLVLLLAFMESIALISILIPCTAILIALGAAIEVGGLPLMPVIIAAIIGAFIGDSVSFVFGRAFQGQIRGSKIYNDFGDTTQKVEHYFQRYGWITYFIGRFLGPVRAVLPLFMGIAGTPLIPFLVVNALSAGVWATAMLCGGFLLGEGFVSVRELL